MNKKITSFIETIKARHSNYSLTPNLVMDESEFISFLEECIYYHPSAFNVQSTRVVLLLNKHVSGLWQHVLDQLPASFPKLLIDELTACKNAYATILFYDDEKITKQASNDYKMPLENFEGWALQSMAMLQITIWNGLTYLGYGVNIQHFNKEIDEYARKEFNIPRDWKLLAQTCVGKAQTTTKDRQHAPVNEMLFIHK